MTKVQEIQQLFKIRYPIVQAGMVWVSGGKLAAAAANAGCLGIIGAGSMTLELLRAHIRTARSLTTSPFGVNLPLLYHGIEEQIQLCLEENIKIFFTSAGSPKKFTSFLKQKGCTVIHVTSSPELAKKCEDAGCDAVVAEGFEAGGHNGRDEITTMALIPQVVDAVKIPVIAAGGIGDGRGIAAALALGASGVQMGTRFAATAESSAHENFKKKITEIGPGDTVLTLKKLTPVRLVINKFCREILELELQNSCTEVLQNHLGKGRAKLGMLDGDLDEGELEIGQIASLTKEILSCSDLVARLILEYESAVCQLPGKL